MIIVGAVVLFFSLLVLVDGTLKLFALQSCSHLNECYSLYHEDPALLTYLSQAEIVYGIIFGAISTLILVAGLLGKTRARIS